MAVVTSGDSRTAEELAASDRELIVHPYLADSVTERVVMVEGHGCNLKDAAGNEYLDATGGLWLAQVGHGRRELADAAARQMDELEYFMSFWEFTNPRAIELAERLIDISPERQKQVYFTSGGSEGNEAAIKIARYAHAREGEPDRTWILARQQAYHGVGYGSGTATGFPIYHEGFGPMLPHVHHLTQPWPYRSELFEGADPVEFLIDELKSAIEKIGAENIAAFIGEPIMGVAGMIIPPDGYWPKVQEVLRENGITFIFDEVVSAYGRTGEWFAAQHFGVEPDIIVTAKGITSGYCPLGAVLISEELAEVIRAEGFPMGYTYNGHPTACAVALANLEVIESDGLLGKAKETGSYILGRLREELGDAEVVGEIRGIGMMQAVELVKDRESREPLPMHSVPEDLIRKEHGVIVRDCQHNVVLSPPLIMSQQEADRVVDAMASVIGKLDSEGNYAS